MKRRETTERRGFSHLVRVLELSISQLRFINSCDKAGSKRLNAELKPANTAYCAGLRER
jgi:hypothetical protein